MKFPRTIRLDASDTHIFEHSAEPGELAVSGAFSFAHLAPDEIAGKTRQAFANGFLGLGGFGRSTLVAVAEIGDEAFERAVASLARHFVDCFGAPDIEAALPAAREEAEFAASLCAHPVNTLLTVSREFGDDGIVERFGTVQPARAGIPVKVWEAADDGA